MNEFLIGDVGGQALEEMGEGVYVELAGKSLALWIVVLGFGERGLEEFPTWKSQIYFPLLL